MRCLNHHLPSTMKEACDLCGGDLHLCGNEGVIALYHCVNCREVYRIRVDYKRVVPPDPPTMGRENVLATAGRNWTRADERGDDL